MGIGVNMAHGENAQHNQSKEFTRKPFNWYPVSERSKNNKIVKRLTNKYERQKEKQME